MATTKAGGKLMKNLLAEIRRNSSEENFMNSLPAKYISSQFRKFETTQQQHCRAREEVQFIGETYLCYLESIRKLKEINAHYTGRGERSVRETADMVGFKLPHDPKP
ncbi:protein FMC1 homolog [Toxorhynchites rutilus septentrionalis]|uniref:protein FMC1 homolog n=1 Tax=Toxorhynchites rutilus septentrionalis TaxID=329112 RepID=UPI00247A2E10|nr:protein FMC1 homolog [Toxorhynchites rutilus septentrionalis]